MSNHQTESATLAEIKMAAEIERLQLENAQLRRPAWRSSAFFLAAAGLSLSLVGNVQQCSSSREARADARQQLGLAQEKWSVEKGKLEAEAEALRQRTKAFDDDRMEMRNEIDHLNSEIAVWDDALLKDNLTLMFQQSKLELAISAGRKFVADAERKNIELTKQGMAYKNKERDILVARRSDLERRLGSP